MMYDQPMIELIHTFLRPQELLFLGTSYIPEALCNVNRWQLPEMIMVRYMGYMRYTTEGCHAWIHFGLSLGSRTIPSK
jgi:hypothetical protein